MMNESGRGMVSGVCEVECSLGVDGELDGSGDLSGLI